MNINAPIEASEAHRLQIVSTGDDLAAVASAWSHLWNEADGLVFQNPDWIVAWWNTLPVNHKHALRIGLLWHGDSLEAVLPLMITRRRGLRILEWAAISCTDYPDILAVADCPVEHLRQLWLAVVEAGGFDIAQLYRLLPDARMRDVVPTGKFKLRPGHRTEVSCRVGGGGYAGEGGWLAQQSKKARQNHRRGYKVLQEGAEVQFRLVDTSVEPIAPIVDQFYLLKRKWLVDTGRQSELLKADAGVIQALVEVLRSLGILRIFVLERSGEIVALSVNFEQRGVMMAFLTTFDPAYDRASPGNLLIVDYIQWSFAQGLRMVDFLCGGERFKFRFASTTVALESLVGARTLLGRAALFANKVRLRSVARDETANDADEASVAEGRLAA
jgi:CelD/BcsL family acetyltransferase involved in cellulose biosynthesis